MAGATNQLPAKDFFRVRSLQELAATNVIGITTINRRLPSAHKVMEVLLQLNLTPAVYDLLRQLAIPICKDANAWRRHQYLTAASNSCAMSASRFVGKHGLHWMWFGTVDLEKMARLIVKEESFGVPGRFVIACTYSFAEDIFSLWKRLPEDKRSSSEEDNGIVKYWKAVLMCDVVRLVSATPWESELYYAIRASLRLNNLSSVKYFWDKMSKQECAATIPQFAGMAFDALLNKNLQNNPCVVPFFVTQINSENQVAQVLDSQDTYFSLLKCALAWPLQDMFIPFFEVVFPPDRDPTIPYSRLEIDNLSRLFEVALRNIGQCKFIDRQAESIVIYLLQRFSETLKESFFSTSRFQLNIGALLYSDSLRLLNIIFKGFEEEASKVAFSYDCLKLMCENINYDNWRITELVVKTMLPRNMRELKRFEFRVISCLLNMSSDEFYRLPDSVVLNTKISAYAIRLEKITEDHFNNR